MIETKDWKETTKDNGSPVMVQVRTFGASSLEVLVWEPDGDYRGMYNHHTITYPKGKNTPWGKIGTRGIPAEISKMAPGSEERCGAVDAFYQKQAEEAAQLARKAYPNQTVQVRNDRIIIIK